MVVRSCILLLVLTLSSACVKDRNLGEKYTANKSRFRAVVKNIESNFSEYNDQFSVKMVNGPLFSLNEKIVSGSKFKAPPFLKRFFRENQETELIVFRDSSVWFRHKTSEGTFTTAFDILICSEKPKTFVDSVARFHYSEISSFKQVDKNWYFLQVTKGSDL